MALDKLVASQPTEGVPPSSQDETVMDSQYAEEASETAVNSDGNNDIEVVEDEAQTRLQKRIDKLTAKAKSEEESRIRLEAKLEAMQDLNKPPEQKSIEELSSSELKEAIRIAEESGDVDESIIDQAKDLLIEKRVTEKTQEVLNGHRQKQSVEDGAELTNLMIDNLTDGLIQDESGEVFTNASTYLSDLASEKYSNINKDHLLAAALAKIDHLKTAKEGPSMTQRIRNNRQQLPQSNNHAATSGGSNIESILGESGGRLTRRTQGKTGSLGKAIRQLGVVKSFQQGE